MLKRALASLSIVVLLTAALVAQTTPKSHWIKIGQSPDRTFEVYPELFQDKDDPIPVGITRNVFTAGENQGVVVMVAWDIRCKDNSVKLDAVTVYAPDGEEVGTKLAGPDEHFDKAPAASPAGKMLEILCAPDSTPTRPLTEIKKVKGYDA